MSIEDRLRALIGTSNSVTGENDATLYDAVQTLCAGFGQGGITPAGSISITANGTYDVTQYASAAVNVPTPQTHSKAFHVTLAAKASNSQIAVAADADVASHYADPSFMIAVVNLNGGSDTNRILYSLVSNTENNGLWGVSAYIQSSVADANLSSDAITAAGPKVYADSGGNLRWFTSNTTSRPWEAGDYLIVAAW